MAKQAVDAPRRAFFMMNPYDVRIIGHDTEHAKGEHHLWDPRCKLPVDQALANNIRTYGVLKAVLAEKDGEHTDAVDGRGRIKACRVAYDAAKAAGEDPPLLPVWFKRGDELEIFGMSRSANQFSRAETAMDNAENAQRMLTMGATEVRVATTFGVKPQTIRDWVKLIGLAAPVRKAVDAGEVSPTAAAGLADLSKEDQVKHLEELRAEGTKPTAEAVVSRVRKAQGKRALVTPKTRIAAAVTRMKEMVVMTPSSQDMLDELGKILVDEAITDLVIEEQAAAAEADAAETAATEALTDDVVEEAAG
jgi:hypothetical protein